MNHAQPTKTSSDDAANDGQEGGEFSFAFSHLGGYHHLGYSGYDNKVLREGAHQPMQSNSLKKVGGGNLPRRRHILWITGVWLGLLIAQLSPCVDMNPDSAIFLTAAKNISQGHGYSLEGKFLRTHPPLFSLMLSTVSEKAPQNFQPEKAIIALFSLGALIGAYWLLYTRYTQTKLVTTALILATCPSLLHLSGKIMSDVPFIFFSISFMAAAASYWQAERTNWMLAFLASIALGLSVLTRSAAAAFYVACFLWLLRPSLWRTNFKRCVLFGTTILVFACPPLLLWVLKVHSSGDIGTGAYTDILFLGVLRGESPFSLRGLFLLLSTELRVIPSQLVAAASAVFRVGGKTGASVTAVLLTPIALVGIIRRFRKPFFIDFAFAAYMLMILCWPITQGARLWLPVLPMLLGYLSDGLYVFANFRQNCPRISCWPGLKKMALPLEKFGKVAPRWGAIILLTVGIVSCVGIAKDSWLECREAIGGVILSGGPEEVAQFLRKPSNRPIKIAYSRFREVQTAISDDANSCAIPVPSIREADALTTLNAIMSSQATHLAVVKQRRRASLGPRLNNEMIEMLRANPNLFSTVLDARHVTVLEIQRKKAPLPNQS